VTCLFLHLGITDVHETANLHSALASDAKLLFHKSLVTRRNLKNVGWLKHHYFLIFLVPLNRDGCLDSKSIKMGGSDKN